MFLKNNKYCYNMRSHLIFSIEVYFREHFEMIKLLTTKIINNYIMLFLPLQKAIELNTTDPTSRHLLGLW